jgi:uncharacterized membrane protein YkvA (DUF1232 family)
MVRRDRADTPATADMSAIRRWARQLKAQLLAIWLCRRHPDMPAAARLLAVFVTAYAFSPIDLIPDFIPVLGLLDDLILVPLGIWIVVRLVPPHVLAAGRAQAEAWMAARKDKPRNRTAALLIVVVWLACGSCAVAYFLAR